MAKRPARSKPAVWAADAALQETDIAIRKAKRWMGFALETAAGVGLVGTGFYDLAHPGIHLLPLIPDWQLIVAGLPLLGAGQPIVQTARKLFGAKGP